MADASQDTLIYANHSPGDLPEWCRHLLDPQRALPADAFHIKRCYLSNSVVVAVTSIPAAFALIMTVLDLWHGKLVLKEWLALFPIFTLPFVWCLFIARRDSSLNKDIAAGRLRMGLFLTPNAILLRMTPDTCSMLPRQWISGFDTALLTVGRGSGRSTYRILLNYRVRQGEQSKERKLSFNCPELEGYIWEHEALLQLLRQWLADGSLPPHGARAERRGPVALTPNRIAKIRREAWQAEQEQASQARRQAEMTQPKPRKAAPVFLPNGVLKTNWECHTEDEYNYFCSLNSSGNVACWENWRNYAPSEMGGSVSFDEFLAGEYQNLLRDEFGAEVLEEIIAAVEYLQANPEVLREI